MKVLVTLSLLLVAYDSYSQCNVKRNTREDGVTVKYISPLPVGHENDIYVALGLETNSLDYFVTLMVVYASEAKKATGILILGFDDNTSVRLPIYLSQKTVIKGMNASISTYNVSSFALSQIKTHRLKVVGFQEVDDTVRTVAADQDQKILSDDYYCLVK